MNAPLQPAVAATALPTTLETPDFGAPAPYIGGQALILSDHYERVERLATLMSKAQGAVPPHLVGNPGACFSVVLTALRANFDPFGVARKTWKGPDGTIKYESQLAIALINNSGLLQQRLRWEYFGDWTKILGRFERRQTKKQDRDGKLKTDANGEIATYIARTWKDEDERGLGVRCIGQLRGEAEPRVTELLMAQAVTRNSTLWVEDPRQQIGYLSGYRWGRLHTPEAIMGIYTPDEPFTDAPVDMGNAVEVIVPKDLLQRAEDAAAKGTGEYSTFWRACTNMERAQLSEQSDHHERLKEVARKADENRTVSAGPSVVRSAGRSAAASPTPVPAAARPSPTPTPAPAPSPAPTSSQAKRTYAEIIELMKVADDPIAVEIAAEWIEQLEDPQQRADAEKFRDERLAELQGGK